MEGAKPYPGILQAFGLILFAVVFTGLYTLSSKVVSTQFGFDVAGNKVAKGMDDLLSYVIPIGMTFIFANNRRKRSGISDGFHYGSFSLTVFTISFVILFCLSFITELFNYLVPPTDGFIRIMKDVMNMDIFSVTGAVIAAPVFEELIMRGIVLDGFLKRYSPAKSILISALIFGVFHLNPWQAVGAFCIGLLFGWLYWKTKSLLLCILLHAANNGAAVLLAMRFKIDETPNMVDYFGPVNYAILFFISMLLIFVCMRFLNKHFRSNPASIHTRQKPV